MKTSVEAGVLYLSHRADGAELYLSLCKGKFWSQSCPYGGWGACTGKFHTCCKCTPSSAFADSFSQLAQEASQPEATFDYP